MDIIKHLADLLRNKYNDCEIRYEFNNIILLNSSKANFIELSIDRDIIKLSYLYYNKTFYDIIPFIIKGIHKIKDYFRFIYMEGNEKIVKIKIVHLVNYRNYLESIPLDIMENVLILYLDKNSIRYLNDTLNGTISKFKIFRELINIEDRIAINMLINVNWYEIYMNYSNEIKYINLIHTNYPSIFNYIIKYNIKTDNYYFLHRSITDFMSTVLSIKKYISFNYTMGTLMIGKDGSAFICLMLMLYFENNTEINSEIIELLFYLTVYQMELFIIIRNKHKELLLKKLLKDQTDNYMIKKIVELSKE